MKLLSIQFDSSQTIISDIFFYLCYDVLEYLYAHSSMHAAYKHDMIVTINGWWAKRKVAARAI